MDNIPITNGQIDNLCNAILEQAAHDEEMLHAEFLGFTEHMAYLRQYAKEDLVTGNVRGLYQIYYLAA